MDQKQWLSFEDIYEDLGCPPSIEEEFIRKVNYRIMLELTKYRLKNNLSQKALAIKLNVTQPMISKYESGDYNISLKNLIHLFYTIGIPLSVIFQDDPNEVYFSPESNVTSSPAILSKKVTTTNRWDRPESISYDFIDSVEEM